MTELYPELPRPVGCLNSCPSDPSAPPLPSFTFADAGPKGPVDTVLRTSAPRENDNSAALLHLQTENLFARYKTLQKEFTHYTKLKRRWNLLNNILHFGRIPVTCGLGLADVALFITGIGAPLAVAGAAVTFGELLSSIAFETFVGNKLHKYNSRIKFIQSWLDRMHVFKCDAQMDGRIDAKEIMQWRALLEEYDHEVDKSQKLKVHEIQTKNGRVAAGADSSPQIQEQLARILQRLPPQQM
jgi:hypothetical protein